MKKPTKKQIEFLRLALGMTGLAAVNDNVAELILVVQAEMRRLGGQYSLRDAARIESEMERRWKERHKQKNLPNSSVEK